MIQIGLTGSIGMGKSTTARFFEKCGAVVFNADQIVHSLLAPDGAAFVKVLKAFPEARAGKRLCRKKLGRLVFDDTVKKEKLESILHPLVWREKRRFLKKAKQEKVKAVLFDIPLLFETGEDQKMDYTICVTATRKTQKERVLRRKNMTPQKLKSILSHQLSDKEKCARADFVLSTEKGLADARKQVLLIWKEIYEG